jgi:hypothetical protein
MPDSFSWDLSLAARQLEQAGFDIVEQEEASLRSYFADVGAVACYAKSVPWQIPDFSIARYRDKLEKLHWEMMENGGLETRWKPFFVVCAKR